MSGFRRSASRCGTRNAVPLSTTDAHKGVWLGAHEVLPHPEQTRPRSIRSCPGRSAQRTRAPVVAVVAVAVVAVAVLLPPPLSLLPLSLSTLLAIQTTSGVYMKLSALVISGVPRCKWNTGKMGDMEKL